MGWFGLPLPEQDGGGGGSAMELVLIAEELGRASLDIAMCYAGTFIPGLTLLKWGTARAARALPARDARRHRPVRHCDERARRRLGRRRVYVPRPSGAATDFVVNGQKMWCTGAGLPGTTIAMYVRTDPEAPKHEGLSLLLVDPDSPGVEIRRTPTLARHILGTNEVFLSDVVVPQGQSRRAR